jgi:hypothetical protein
VSETEYCCSAFLGIMVSMKKKHPQIELKLINPNEFLLELLSVSGVRKFITIIATE